MDLEGKGFYCMLVFIMLWWIVEVMGFGGWYVDMWMDIFVLFDDD